VGKISRHCVMQRGKRSSAWMTIWSPGEVTLVLSRIKHPLPPLLLSSKQFVFKRFNIDFSTRCQSKKRTFLCFSPLFCQLLHFILSCGGSLPPSPVLMKIFNPRLQGGAEIASERVADQRKLIKAMGTSSPFTTPLRPCPTPGGVTGCSFLLL
jgi:hypothetical protein